MSRKSVISRTLDAFVDLSLSRQYEKKRRFINRNSEKLGIVDTLSDNPCSYDIMVDVDNVPLHGDRQTISYLNDLERFLEYTSDILGKSCNKVLIDGTDNEVMGVKRNTDQLLEKRKSKKIKYRELLNRGYKISAVAGTAAVAVGWSAAMIFFENYSEAEKNNTLDNLLITGIASVGVEAMVILGLYQAKRAIGKFIIPKTESSLLNRLEYSVKE